MPRITAAMTRGTPYLRQRALRSRHIAAAIDKAGGNKLVAEALSRMTGREVHRNRLAQWRNQGYVPADCCKALVVLSLGTFEPGKVRHRWLEERAELPTPRMEGAK